MIQKFGTLLWLSGSLMVAWALSVSVSMMFDWSVPEAQETFRQGLFIFAAVVVFGFIFRAKLKKEGVIERAITYVVIPAAGLVLAVYGWCQQFAPGVIASLQ